MGMDDSNPAFARLNSAIIYGSNVGMQKWRREKGEEKWQCGYEEFRVTHFGYYIQSVSPGQPQ